MNIGPPSSRGGNGGSALQDLLALCGRGRGSNGFCTKASAVYVSPSVSRLLDNLRKTSSWSPAITTSEMWSRCGGMPVARSTGPSAGHAGSCGDPGETSTAVRRMAPASEPRPCAHDQNEGEAVFAPGLNRARLASLRFSVQDVACATHGTQPSRLDDLSVPDGQRPVMTKASLTAWAARTRAASCPASRTACRGRRRRSRPSRARSRS